MVAWRFAVGPGRDDSLGSHVAYGIPQVVSVVSLVGDHGTGAQAVPQRVADVPDDARTWTAQGQCSACRADKDPERAEPFSASSVGRTVRIKLGQVAPARARARHPQQRIHEPAVVATRPGRRRALALARRGRARRQREPAPARTPRRATHPPQRLPSRKPRRSALNHFRRRTGTLPG